MGRVWVAVDGPFNEHLVRDVGGLNLGLAFVAVLALVTGNVAMARVAGGAALIYGVPHLLYHATHLDPFDTGDALAMLGSFGFAALAALLAGGRPDCRPTVGSAGPGSWRRHHLDEGVHPVEPAGPVAEREVRHDHLVETHGLPGGHGLGHVVGGAGDGGPAAGALEEGVGSITVVGEQHEGLGGAGDRGRVAADGLAAPVEHSGPLGDDVGQAPHVPLVGVAGDHAHHPVALAADEGGGAGPAPALGSDMASVSW